MASYEIHYSDGVTRVIKDGKAVENLRYVSLEQRTGEGPRIVVSFFGEFGVRILKEGNKVEPLKVNKEGAAVSATEDPDLWHRENRQDDLGS